MSRIEINQCASADQPKFIGKEGEFKGKHGARGFVKKASLLARIFGYYVKVEDHYLNPKSLANYTNTKNAGKEGAPALKPRWIGGTPNSKIKDAFLALFPTQSKTTSEPTNTPSSSLQQQQTATADRTHSGQLPPSPIKYIGGTPEVEYQPVSFDMQQIGLIYKDRGVQDDLYIALCNPSFEAKFKNDLKAYLDTLPEQNSQILEDINTTTVNAIVNYVKKGDVIDLRHFEEAGTDALRYLEQITEQKIIPRMSSECLQEPMKPKDLAIHPKNHMKFLNSFTENTTFIIFTNFEEGYLTQIPTSTPPLKYEGAKPDSFDMQQIGLIYVDKELRENLRSALNDPEFEAKFKNDLHAYLNTIPDQYGQTCSSERWSVITGYIKTRIVNEIVKAIKKDEDRCVLYVKPGHFIVRETNYYLHEIRKRNIFTKIGITLDPD